MAAEGTDSLIFIDDITADGSSKINYEVYGHIHICSSSSQCLKLIGLLFFLQQDNDPKHTAKETKNGQFFSGRVNHQIWTQLSMPFIWWRETSPRNKHELKMTAIQAWQSITREDTQQLVMSMNHKLQAVIACKVFPKKY